MRSQVGSIKSSVVLRASTACLIALSVSACSSDTMRFTETPFDSPFRSARLSSQPVRDPVTTGSINPSPVAPVQSAPLSAPVASQPLPAPQSAVALRDNVQPLPVYGGVQSAPAVSRAPPRSVVPAPAATARVAQAAPEPRFVPGPAPAARQAAAPAAAPVVDAKARAQATAADVKAKAEADAAAMRESRARFAAEAKAKAEARKTAAAPVRAAAPAVQPAPVQAQAPVQTPVRAKPVEVASAPATTRPSAVPKAAPVPAPQAAQPVQDPKTTASLPKPEEAAVSEKADFRWPARGRVIAGFSGKGGNEGINIAVPEGTPIRAAESGTVAYAGNELKGYGNLVLIRHPNGYVSAYANNGELKVKRGETVTRGQVVANSGQTGNVSSPQLHFELRKGAVPVDPTPYLNN